MARDFKLERRGKTWVVVWAGEGVRPATDTEVVLWQELQRLEASLKRIVLHTSPHTIRSELSRLMDSDRKSAEYQRDQKPTESEASLSSGEKG